MYPQPYLARAVDMVMAAHLAGRKTATGQPEPYAAWVALLALGADKCVC